MEMVDREAYRRGRAKGVSPDLVEK